MLKISNNFYLEEWVPKIIYDMYGNQSLRFIDLETVATAQKIRNRWGKSMLINDWHKGEDGYGFNFRGYRPPETGMIRWFKSTIGKKATAQMLEALPKERREYLESVDFGSWYSAHKLARGFDYNISGVPTEEIYEDILNNKAWYLEAGVTRIEDIKIARTWAHNDTLTTPGSDLIIVGG